MKNSLEIDSRPSDAIAIGLRFNAPIYTYEIFLAEAGIELTDELEEEPDLEKELEQIKPKKENPHQVPKN
jgi:bifunctional DNase/RNase